MARDRPIVWLESEVKTPPFSPNARIDAGVLLRRLQKGERLAMPHSRPMSSIGKRCHELRIRDIEATWRIIYHVAIDAILILGVFSKKTSQTPKAVIAGSKRRLNEYERLTRRSR